MSNLSGNHLFGSIGETRVTFVEKKVGARRKDFLKALLEHNGLDVIIDEIPPKEEGEETLFTVGVTDMVFNPTTYIYQRRLLTLDGRIVNRDYWMQESDDTKPQYWRGV